MALLDAIHALVIFLSAFLLFLVEPMTAKRLLPMLGGSAAVWITCLVFFQTALLVGYLYAHLVSSRLRPRTQAAVHSVVLLLALCSLGATLGGGARADATASWHPLLATLRLLCAMIGLPFIALAATTPLVQSWCARGRTKTAGWWFYALSNLGSMLALIVYPWLIEPHLPLDAQRIAWAIGFLVFALACGAVAWLAAPASARMVMPETQSKQESSLSGAGTETKINSSTPRTPEQKRVRPARPEPRLPSEPLRRALWVLLPAASSMLLCTITAHLSQNIAAIPLLWIVPLAAYLLSFIITFAGPRWYPRWGALGALAFFLAILGYLVAEQISVPLLLSIPTFVISLFVFCFFCHGELYRLRPSNERATQFYLLLSLGSAMGAICIGVAAPLISSSNYDLALSLTFLVVLAMAASWDAGVPVRIFWLAATAGLVWAAALNVRALRHNTISQLRSFYGSLRVTQIFAIPGPGVERTLFHGTIQHGTQIFNDQLRGYATTYYAPDSGVGLALRYCCHKRPRRVGVVGLGTGTLAAYGLPGDDFTFYEIDPLVERLARARFTYLHDCKAPLKVVLGDARVSMEHEPIQHYDVLVLDAFTGDAIPIHLLTAEAIALYRRHLEPGGVLAFHVSSQYVDLAPVLAEEARHADMIALGVHSLADDELGEFQADWVLMSADPAFFNQPDVAIAARPILPMPGLHLWTDDFNSLLPLVNWMGIQGGNPSAPQSK